ncbi:translocation and assembly module lipoprotein TamL [Myroides pelagicus]|uniref:BamA/TamA family outer membrane protein n=1 Tax=Myroides pelagicus TaxID=270914 RepID=A0A7K1GM96_9FLAO|nr:BamA/TamA family outer membrane protein [Myroides pelagicus]MEC4113071.1 BamA/TamA family outer membrane protein [Myroides pelagicus]MTH29976.1 BamA/TamA family outer membrane protein [Myroides pelagicus]
MKVRSKDILSAIALGIIGFTLNSCSSTRYLKEGEELYVGPDIVIDSDSLSKKHKEEMKLALNDLLRPVPNTRVLGVYPNLALYNMAGNPEKTSKLRRWMRNKLGEAPVLFSQVDLEYNSAILTNRLENHGFFNVTIESDTLKTADKKKGVRYHVTPGEQYKINEVTFLNDSTPLQQLIYDAKNWTRLKKGKAYNLDDIKEERVRFDNYVKNKGYYYFSPNNLLVQVDSTVGNHKVDLFVKVKDDAPKPALKAYTIDKVYVFADYNISDGDYMKGIDSADQYNGMTIVDPKGKFKSSIYDRTIYLEKGETYNRNDHNLSLNRLVNLGVFKFVKNSFEISDSINNKLDAYYFLTPDNPKAIRVELLGKTNSASYNGAELNVNWSNKNFFKGAELFSVSAYGGADFQSSARNNGYNVYKAGLEASLTWPRLIAPIDFNPLTGHIPKTKTTVGYEFLQRSKLYSLNSFKASWGYLWKQSTTIDHQFNVLETNYVSPNNVTALYQEYAKGNPSLERVLDKQLIFGPTYTFTFTNTMKQHKTHTFYYRGSLDFSGNITGLVMGADVNKEKEKTILGVPFSQYIKTEHDFRHYLKLGRTSQFVSRIHAGVGYAYGNSTAMPYTKQFYVGGSNSVRAFRARTLGPGSFDPRSIDSNFIPDQSGDVLIEMNLEYRKKLISIIHGALFVDAGNVWNLSEVSDRPGGKFSGDFYKEFAMGAGLGLRFDITFLVVRFDLAFPLRVPYYEEGSRWVIDDIRLGDRQWRKDNLMLNFAIGYPF